ncbi:DDE_3 domain-containing protein [Trichonephila clavipes]|nr:DDE_3 domain-containing protein [Trichonephila clavipes]
MIWAAMLWFSAEPIDDNAPIHAVGFVQSWFDEPEEEVKHLHWPTQLPDLNLIEPLWSILQHSMRNRYSQLAFLPELTQLLHKECDKAHFWLNGYVNKQNCRIWSEANPQVYVETPLHPEKLTVWCALWAGGILLQKR